MSLDVRVVGESVAVLSYSGRLTLFEAPALEGAVAEAIDDSRSHIVVDLSETSFIDSSGLGALIAGLKKSRHAGGDLRISGARAEVLAVLRMTNVDRLLPNHSSAADAQSDW